MRALRLSPNQVPKRSEPFGGVPRQGLGVRTSSRAGGACGRGSGQSHMGGLNHLALVILHRTSSPLAHTQARTFCGYNSRDGRFARRTISRIARFVGSLRTRPGRRARQDFFLHDVGELALRQSRRHRKTTASANATRVSAYPRVALPDVGPSRLRARTAWINECSAVQRWGLACRVRC